MNQLSCHRSDTRLRGVVLLVRLHQAMNPIRRRIFAHTGANAAAVQETLAVRDKQFHVATTYLKIVNLVPEPLWNRLLLRHFYYAAKSITNDSGKITVHVDHNRI